MAQSLINQAMLERITSALEGRGSYEPLADETSRSDVAEWVEKRRLWEHLSVKQRDIQDDEPPAVRHWLRELPVEAAEQVTVLWVSSRFGASMSFQSLVEAYDDLWFPSANDLWVYPPSKAWLLELSHEEVFQFFTGKPHP